MRGEKIKLTYIIIFIVLLSLLGLFLVKKKSISTTNNQSEQKVGDVKITELNENLYEVLREQAFKITSEQLEIQIPKDQTKVYGIIMDLNIGRAVVTVVAFKTGDASIYLSSGQAFIGGFAHETVKKAGLNFVNSAQAYLTKAQKTNSTSLPEKGCVKFFLLTNNGTFMHQEIMKDIENNKSDWAVLFSYGNQVITEYRLITDKE